MEIQKEEDIFLLKVELAVRVLEISVPEILELKQNHKIN